MRAIVTAMLLIAALATGATAGAVVKFGFGYDLDMSNHEVLDAAN